jgi:hypothetical protein
MRERHATCGREAKSTVFAKDMAEGASSSFPAPDPTRPCLRCHPITCYVARVFRHSTEFGSHIESNEVIVSTRPSFFSIIPSSIFHNYGYNHYHWCWHLNSTARGISYSPWYRNELLEVHSTLPAATYHSHPDTSSVEISETGIDGSPLRETTLH